MSAPFDPYANWLGIPPQHQPPDHYQLLGVSTFERDDDTIAAAADARMKVLRSYQSGTHSRESQKLLNEVSAARVCLLNQSRRADYENELQARRRALNLPPLPFPPDLVPRKALPTSSPEHIRQAIPADPDQILLPTNTKSAFRQRLDRWIVPTVVGLVAVAGLAIALIWYSVTN